MARLFSNGSGTDGLSFGSPAVLDDLCVNNTHTLIVWVGRRTANDGAMGVYGKSTALTTSGISVWVENSADPFTTHGHIRCAVGRATSLALAESGTGDTTTDTMVLNQQEIGAVQFNATTGITIYRSAIDTWITEVSSYLAGRTAGSGAVGADASANATFGLAPAVGADPFTGDLGFCLVYARNSVYSVSDIQRIQTGVLSYLDAVEHGLSTTRAVAIWQSVTGYKLLGYLASNGTFTDHSGNSITGTLTGTSAGTDDTGWHVPGPGAFRDDGEDRYSSDVREQNDYAYTSAHARFEITSAATAGTALIHRTLDDTGTTYDNQAVIGLLVDGVYTDTLTTGSSEGRARDTFAGLAASSKTITFQNGARSAPSTTRSYEGTWLVAVRLNAAGTRIVPSAPSNVLVIIGDSVEQGFLCNPPQEDAPLQQLRISGFSPTYDSVEDHGAGGMAGFDIFGDATKRAEHDGILARSNVRRVLIQLAANDQIGADWTDTNFQTGLDTFCDDLLAVSGFNGDITLVTVTDWAAGLGNANANGDTIENFRQRVRDVVTSQATNRVVLCEIGDGLLDPTTDLDADGVHLNITGANLLRPVYAAATVDIDELDSAGSAVFTGLRIRNISRRRRSA